MVFLLSQGLQRRKRGGPSCPENVQLLAPCGPGQAQGSSAGSAHVAAGWSQAGTAPPRQEDLSRHYLRPVVTACSRPSGAGTRCIVRSPRGAAAQNSRLPGVPAAPPGQVPLFPISHHTGLSPLWLLSGASLAPVCWSLHRGEFQGPEIWMKSHL